MMSKNSFWANVKENLKRRAWTAALCSLAFFLYFPVAQVMGSTAVQKRMEREVPYYHNYRGIDPHTYLKQYFMEGVSFKLVFLVLTAGLAVLLAIQGFSYLYSRRKSDLYLSVPVSAKKRFAVIYVNGVGIYASLYLVMLLLALIAGGLLGIVDANTCAMAAIAYVCNILFFITIYNFTIAVVMLTGNVLVTILGTGTLLLYEAIIKEGFNKLCVMFYRTYAGRLNDSGLAYLLSPVHIYVNTSDDILRMAEGYGGVTLAGVVLGMVQLVVLAGLFGGLGYFFYRKRPAEAAGKAMAFPASKTPIKLLVMIPFTLFMGIQFWELSERNIFYTVLGMVIGLFTCHGLLQLLYEADLHSVLKRKWHIAAAGIVSGLIFLIFYVDLLGYDKYVPDLSEIESVGFAFEDDAYCYSTYSNPFERQNYSYTSTWENMRNSQGSAEPDTIGAILRIVEKDQADKTDFAVEVPGIRTVYLKYRLTGGKTVFRKVAVNLNESCRELDTIFVDEAFQRDRYQILAPIFDQYLDELDIFYGNGIVNMKVGTYKEELLARLRQDLKKYDCSLMLNDLPVGMIEFRYSINNEDYLEWSLPVYEEFADTIGILKKADAYQEWNGTFADPSQIASIVVTCYNFREEDRRMAGSSYTNGLEVTSYAYMRQDERAVTETFTEPDEIEQIAPALYPEALEYVTGSDLTGRFRDLEYEVTVTYKPGVRFDSYTANRFIVREELLPAFVIDRTRLN